MFVLAAESREIRVNNKSIIKDDFTYNELCKTPESDHLGL